jgi:hypothetical protein
LQAIADVFGDVGSNLIHARDDGTFGVVCSPSLEHCVAEYAAGWSDRDTRANRGRDRGYFMGRIWIESTTDASIARPPT